MTTLTSQNVLTLLGVLLVGLVGLYVFVLRREGRSIYRLAWSQWLVLWVMRCSVVSLVLFALARPAYKQVRTEERLPVLPILVDESVSMTFPDSRENPLVQAQPASQRTRWHTAQQVAQRLQEKLTRTHRVRLYSFSDSLKLLQELPQRAGEHDPVVRREELFAQQQPTGEHSNLGDAVSDLFREVTGEKVSGVVLLSDGRQTGGLELASAGELALSAKVPVHTVVLGSEFPLRDLRIDEVLASAEASLGDVLMLQVKVTNQISNTLRTEITLEEKDGQAEQAEYKEVARKTLVLQRGQQLVSLATIPEVEGLRKYRLTLPVQPDEVNIENNRAELTVKVVKRTLKVLLIAGQPSREYYYLVPTLLRDPIIDLSCFLQSADVDYVQQGNSGLERLPATLKDWQKFDVCLLCDVDPNGITTQQLAGLENMVAKGGGLLVLAGRNHGLAKLVQVHAAKIRGLLPMEIDKNLHLDHDRVYDKPYRLSRTPKGKAHPLLLASTDTQANEQIWDTFEKLNFYWHHPIQSLKPKAISLLERTGASAGEEKSVLALQRYEEGAVCFSTIDSLWLWRYPAESHDYDRLWTRIIRYLGEAKLLGTQQQVALATDRRLYRPGEEVQIALRVLDPALLAQLAGQPMHVSVTSEAKDQYMVPLTIDPKGEPLYRGSYRARRLGSMLLQARQAGPEADSEAKPLFDVKHSFQVRMQSLEEADTSADLKAMESLAQRTQGRYFDYHTMGDIDSLLADIPAEPDIRTETITQEVWDGWTLLLLFLGLVCAELSLRKWWGML